MKRVFLNFFCFAFLTVLILNFGFSPFLEIIFLKIFRNEILVPHRNVHKGFFHIMIGDLLAVGRSHWPDQMAHWRRHFKTEIDIRPMDRTYFSRKELAELEAGIIVMRGNVNIAGNDFYQRIGNSRFTLQLGMTSVDHDVWEIAENAVIWAVIFVYTGLPAVIWAYPFWRKLRHLRTTAMAFAQGDFDRRVKVPKYSALSSISETFNLMARRIQGLISSQRQLTLAVSRELSRPVSRIRSQYGRLAQTFQKEAFKMRVEAMRKDIDGLESLIDRILTYARFDGNPPRLSTRIYPLVSWLTEIVDYMEIDLEGKRFEMCDQTQNNCEAVCFDPKYLGQAVANVLSNAAIYGRQRVEMTIGRQGGFILLHIDDDGPGIPLGDRYRLFNPFTRLDVGRRLNPGGFGLGLAIVQRVMQWHGGSVVVGNSPLGGARVTLKWPATGV